MEECIKVLKRANAKGWLASSGHENAPAPVSQRVKNTDVRKAFNTYTQLRTFHA
jgi:hypothetical protein